MGLPDPDRDSQFYEGVPTRRLVAFGIDLIVIVALWVVVFIVGTIFSLLTLGIGTPLAVALLSATGFLYRWIMLMRSSATVGMILTGIEIRDSAGRRLSELLSLLHTTGFYVTLFFPPLLVIGWMLMAISPHRRLMHDFFLGSAAINRPE